VNKRFALPALIAACLAALFMPTRMISAEEPPPNASAWVTTQQTQVRLIAAENGLGKDGAVRLGLQFKLKDGWKIYWRRPGDAGFPPRLDWAESENFASADFAWPAPMRFQVLGFQTMGYTREVVFPITAKALDPGQPLKAHVRLDYLTCDEVCIPYFAQLSYDIPAKGNQSTEHAGLIESFIARVPRDGSADGLSIDKIETSGTFRRLDASARAGAVRVRATSNVAFDQPDVFIEGPDLTFFGAPDVRLSDGGKSAILTVPVTLEENASLDLASVRLTMIDGARSAERTLPVEPGAIPLQPAAGPKLPYLTILLLAALGGFILNLMPCVLPVLSLKILSVVSRGGHPTTRIRASFLVSAAGILASFVAIAAALGALKYAGMEIGWGIQFQNPWFVGTLAAITLLFAANLLGAFHIPLPAWLGAVAAPRASASDTGSSLAGDFAAGTFATLLATPCSAPFLGTAIGFALAGEYRDILVVFAAMGIGMASPYLVFAALPQIAKVLPRPGAWMVRLKQVLGLGLAATAIWLMTIVAAQLGPDEPVAYDARDAGHAAKSGADFWTPFDPTSIAELVADGKTVFVDITADWCITCQVNKAVVLDRPPVRVLLEDKNVVAMRGDWTRPDPLIAAYLQSFGRYAIPFNAVYGPASPSGIALSELLGSGEVTAALNRASGGTLAASRP
jgi:suppressor for copper-sensitivity B